jgi:membrane protein insertase Oxa1/YidC/SpoIIIJ
MRLYARIKVNPSGIQLYIFTQLPSHSSTGIITSSSFAPLASLIFKASSTREKGRAHLI